MELTHLQQSQQSELTNDHRREAALWEYKPLLSNLGVIESDLGDFAARGWEVVLFTASDPNHLAVMLRRRLDGVSSAPAATKLRPTPQP